jgi:hypothetical protein
VDDKSETPTFEQKSRGFLYNCQKLEATKIPFHS